MTVKPGGAKVMSWDFEELREMLSDHPNMSVCFNTALASAMVAKLLESHDPAIKYRQLLKARLSVHGCSFGSVSLSVCICVFIKLHITAQSGPVILFILVVI